MDLIIKQPPIRYVKCTLFQRGLDALLPREHSEVADPEREIADCLHDGVTHVRDEDSEGGDGEQGPEDEEGLPGVGFRVDITITDGEEGGVGKVEGGEVAPFLRHLCKAEDKGAEEPKEEPGGGGND